MSIKVKKIIHQEDKNGNNTIYYTKYFHIINFYLSLLLTGELLSRDLPTSDIRLFSFFGFFGLSFLPFAALSETNKKDHKN